MRVRGHSILDELIPEKDAKAEKPDSTASLSSPLPTSCRKQSALCRRPLLQNPNSLPDRQPRPRSPSDEALEDTLRVSRAVPRKQQLGDPLPIPAPLLNLIEVAPVGVERVVGFFVGPVIEHRLFEGWMWQKTRAPASGGASRSVRRIAGCNDRLSRSRCVSRLRSSTAGRKEATTRLRPSVI